MTSVIRELDRCVFCGDPEMTEEHLIADWAYRAFARSRKPKGMLRGAFIAPGQVRLDPDDDPVLTARVICRRCNNEWLSAIDNAAAGFLKPLIRGEREVELDRMGQTAVAAWIYKSALILDAAERGPIGELAALRAGFMATRQAGPGAIIYIGPAEPPGTMTIGDPPTTVNLWMLGVRPTYGRVRLQGTVVSHDGKTVTRAEPKVFPIPGYQVMVGALWAYLGGRVPPVTADALRGFEPIWPAQDEPVLVRAASLDTRESPPAS